MNRVAPYGHLADEDSLLTAVAIEARDQIGDQIQVLRAHPGLSTAGKLHTALTGFVEVRRRQPTSARELVDTLIALLPSDRRPAFSFSAASGPFQPAHARWTSYSREKEESES